MNLPHRSKIAALASSAFATHELQREGTGRWLCRRPGTGYSGYWFRVIEAPATIVVLGDITYAILECSDRNSVAWLRSALRNEGDPNYVLGKVVASRVPLREFFTELARGEVQRLREQGTAWASEIEEVLGDLTDGPEGAARFAEAYYEASNDAEVPSCSDWSSETLWLYHALRTFVRLLLATDQAAPSEGATERTAP